jgi:glutamate-1-semialdehyde 2,1-aminomutase
MLSLSDRYCATFPRSRERAAVARQLFPDGVTHDIRHLTPFPVYIERAQGAYKWTIDGHRLIDYFCGHGALLLGHGHPQVVQAVQAQMERGTHLGACHEYEIAWAEQVQRLVPTAERIRFTASGTEATLMAFRLARLFTGKSRIVKLAGHFHGWHDAATPAAAPPYDQPTVPGVPAGVAAHTLVIPPNDLAALETLLTPDHDIAAVILEPTGGHWGAVPIRSAYLHGLRELTARHGVLLIFDEVITGFRVAPGGAQAFFGVRPDLTTLAKVLAGGLPGGALVGRAEVLAGIEHRPGKPKMRHPGTFNGNPLSAAAGVVTLQTIAAEPICATVNALARQLRTELNALFAAENWPWVAYGDFSLFHLRPDYHGERPHETGPEATAFIPYNGDLNALDGPRDADRVHRFRQALLLHGVDLPGFGGWLSAAHTPADVTATVQAVQAALRWGH